MSYIKINSNFVITNKSIPLAKAETYRYFIRE